MNMFTGVKLVKPSQIYLYLLFIILVVSDHCGIIGGQVMVNMHGGSSQIISKECSKMSTPARNKSWCNEP